MAITPFILGRGRAGRAVEEALAILKLEKPELDLRDAVWMERGQRLEKAPSGQSIAFLTNPPGLHAERIIEAVDAGFDAIATEKPVCVSLDEIRKLEEVSKKCEHIAIYHVYRMMWGPQTLREMIERDDFGEIISIEGRYWQSSTAERALKGVPVASWKNDRRLSGPSDALLDVGTHWVDMAAFLMNDSISKASVWKSYVNAESAHRDTHVQLVLSFAKGGRALSSISKTMHGATNHFEINVIGSMGSATWKFLEPDEIHLGKGRDRSVLTRKTTGLGSGYPPFHAMGWLEGYIEITKRLVMGMRAEKNPKNYPRLDEALPIIERLLTAKSLE